MGQTLADEGLAEAESNIKTIISDRPVTTHDSLFDKVNNSNEKETTTDDQTEALWDLPNRLPEDIVNCGSIYDAANLQYWKRQGDKSEEELPIDRKIRPSQSTNIPCTQPPRQLSFMSVNCTDIPPLALVENVSPYKSGVPNFLWGQDRASLFLRVMSCSMTDLHPGRVYVKVRENSLLLQVLEVEPEGQGETFTLRQTQELQLQGEVMASETKVVVRPRVVEIKLLKVRRAFMDSPHL